METSPSRRGEPVLRVGKVAKCPIPPQASRSTEELQEEYSRRRSFCCAEANCRKRTTPASFRILRHPSRIIERSFRSCDIPAGSLKDLSDLATSPRDH